MDNILCHIVILNSNEKKKILNNKKFNKLEFIDLDKINQEIFNEDKIIKLYKKYQNMKTKKNDNYKEIDKKITKIWEDEFLNRIEQNLTNKKKTILLGQIHHYRLINKKINLPIINKFILKEDLRKNTQLIIKHNLDKNYNDIISGRYLIENLDYKNIKKKLQNIYNSYIKDNYIEKSCNQINKIIELYLEKKIKGTGLWISLKDEYKINSKIHPNKNHKIFAYNDPVYAIVSSIKFNSNDLNKSFHNNKVKLKIFNEDKCYKKLQTKRFIYLVDKHNFIPHEKGKNIKYFSQIPVKILDKEKIDNVYKKFQNLNIIID